MIFTAGRQQLVQSKTVCLPSEVQQILKQAARTGDAKLVAELLPVSRVDMLSGTTQDFSGIIDALHNDDELVVYKTIDAIVQFYTPKKKCPKSCRLKCELRRQSFINHGLSHAVVAALVMEKSSDFIGRFVAKYNPYPLSEISEYKQRPSILQGDIKTLQTEHPHHVQLQHFQCDRPQGYVDHIGIPVLTGELPKEMATRYRLLDILQTKLCPN
jgi:hypothetical protein